MVLCTMESRLGRLGEKLPCVLPSLVTAINTGTAYCTERWGAPGAALCVLGFAC